MSTHPSDVDAGTFARRSGVREHCFHIFDSSNYQTPRSLCGVSIDPSALRTAPTKDALPQAVTCPRCLRKFMGRSATNQTRTSSHHRAGQDKYGHFVLFNAGTDREFRAAMPCSEVAHQSAAAPELIAACSAVLRLSKTLPVTERWHVVIDGVVESRHKSRQLARRRIDRLKTDAIAKARGEVGR